MLPLKEVALNRMFRVTRHFNSVLASISMNFRNPKVPILAEYGASLLQLIGIIILFPSGFKIVGQITHGSSSDLMLAGIVFVVGVVLIISGFGIIRFYEKRR